MAEHQNEPNNTTTLVTEVHLQLTRRPPVLAYVSVTLWGCVAIHDLRLLERHDQSRVVLMPRQQLSDGTWSTIAHPVQEEVRATPTTTGLRPSTEIPIEEAPPIPARVAEA
jgi:DNA-binding cell septation regulator SpoVG